MIVPSTHLKDSIMDEWDKLQGRFQLVSLRKPEDYNNAGHIPGAMNIYWAEFLVDENLAKFDTAKTLMLYCYHGHGSMICSSILELLGYECRSLGFGMMDWNQNALVKPPWDREADYETETVANEPDGNYSLPMIVSTQRDARKLVKETALRYLGGEGSPVIAAADVKAMVDNWGQTKVEYQIVDVRLHTSYLSGHVPHSINIPLAEIARTENLRKLDPRRTTIVCSENGQAGQVASTVLSLLGYRAVNMKFGMMDWNKSHVDESRMWDGIADYSTVL